MSSTILLRGSSISSDIGQLAASVAQFGVGSTESGSQSDETFLSMLRDHVIPAWQKVGLSGMHPGLLIVDGHASRLRSEVTELLEKSAIACIVMPSHTSLLHQPCDLGLMSHFQAQYEVEMRVKLRVSLSTNTPITDRHRVECVVKVTTDMVQPEAVAIIRAGFTRCGLPGGRVDTSHLRVRSFVFAFNVVCCSLALIS